MKHLFQWNCSVCIKKDSSQIIGQEYYFIPKTQQLSYVAEKIKYKYNTAFEEYHFVEYSFDFHDEQWELNMFDTHTAAYYVSWDTIKRKNIYFGFQAQQVQEAFQCFKKSVYPYNNQEILRLLSWSKYQRSDGNIIIGTKENAESIYFSRINFLWFLKFMQEFWWKDHIWEYLQKNSEYLKYYLFDINLQFTYKDKKMCIEKTSIYGLL